MLEGDMLEGGEQTGREREREKDRVQVRQKEKYV